RREPGIAQPIAKLAFERGIGDDGERGLESRAKLGERHDVAMRRERADAEAIRMPRDDVERARADRAGRAEQCDRSHGANARSSSALPRANTGSAANMPSRRSNIPPWPGNNVPESFTPAWRLMRLSKRSPMIDATTVTSASAINATHANPRKPSSQPPVAERIAPLASAPYTP